jgi:phage baseplate assembly protein W
MALQITFEKPTSTEYTYSDLSLDLQKEFIPLGESNSIRKSGNSDIDTDFDEQAIGNSLRNLFSTRPKQRILNPEYGLDFHQFLFENVNEFSARSIARRIAQGIEKYETRVTVNFLNIDVDAENNKYNISLSVNLPSLGKNFNYGAIFTENGFTI